MEKRILMLALTAALLCVGDEVISLAVLMVWAAVAVAKLFVAMGKGGYFN